MNYWTSGCDCGADICTCPKPRRPKPVVPEKQVFEVYRSFSMKDGDDEGPGPLHLLWVRGNLTHIKAGEHVRVVRVEIPEYDPGLPYQTEDGST